ncbi:VOC family protein [Amycolatopsis sp. K13G38]|uniref:VOC family protein n=1 Tax=Amycolatopsis acididurans TaxID=2724524 RepID=A0ABX1J664_9PSEU|nr:VOC family protein [Amycolatopsis acididurans]NKQ55069.1 VOC family protein [Amycolatopsis acididurans]
MVPTFGCVVLDCPDPLSLAEFYAAVLDWSEPKVQHDGHWVTLTGPTGVEIAFQRVENYRAPEWPSQTMPQQFHLDLDVKDLDAGQERVLGLGARLLDDKPETFRVYADPAGHPFCLCAC